MTTAHRPTFDPARGREARRGPAYHQRLQPSHTHLKTRQPGQGGIADAKKRPRDLRKELLAAERAVRARKGGDVAEEQEQEQEQEEDAEAARRREILEAAADVDADSVGESSSSDEEEGRSDKKANASSDDDSDSEDDSDSDDEEAQLLRELAKIKAERAAARAKEEAERAAAATEEREAEIARGNPLLNNNINNNNNSATFGVKRRWDDDVVFKNQGRGTEGSGGRGKGGEFVNDLLRSDFHKRFMSRYVR